MSAEDAVRAEVARQVPGLELPAVPRRFLLCEYDEDDRPALYGWGLELPGRAVAFSPALRSTWHSDSAEQVHAGMSRVSCVDLVWIDTAPSPDTP
ncbi:MAG: hypothetical protein WCA46_21765 [Actinocatenispora sp.]